MRKHLSGKSRGRLKTLGEDNQGRPTAAGYTLGRLSLRARSRALGLFLLLAEHAAARATDGQHHAPVGIDKLLIDVELAFAHGEHVRRRAIDAGQGDVSYRHLPARHFRNPIVRADASQSSISSTLV